MTNGATTEAALFRNLGLLGVCTAVLDENEADANDRTQSAVTKILKVGFEWDGVVERCLETTRDGVKNHSTQRYPVFGPKIVAAIAHVPDVALRSRCFSIQMRKSRDVVVELPRSYEGAVLALQNKLLAYRLDHFFAPPAEPKRLDVDGRLEQLRLPLAKVATLEQLAYLDALILDMQDERDDEAERDPDDVMAAVIRKRLAERGSEPIAFNGIVDGAALHGVVVSAQTVGYFVTRLGLKKKRSEGNRGPRFIDATREEILCALETVGYGGNVPDQVA